MGVRKVMVLAGARGAINGVLPQVSAISLKLCGNDSSWYSVKKRKVLVTCCW